MRGISELKMDCINQSKNYRLETIKLLKENTGRTLFDIYYSKILFDPPPRMTEIKTKI